jgi:hypothetical protein
VPAFVSRIAEDAGPRARVFRDDSAWAPRLAQLRIDAKEADRRLQLVLAAGTKDKASGQVTRPTIKRFEISDTLRASTLALLPAERPWSRTLSPALVATALESFLVEEVPANPPDFELLKPLGADAAVELVVEEYGLRAEDGKAGVYVVGYARMFFLDGGGDLWFRAFRADEVETHQADLDPLKVARDATLFRDRLVAVLKAISEVLARDLNPPDRAGGRPLGAERDPTWAPDAVRVKKNAPPQEAADDLPAPQ